MSSGFFKNRKTAARRSARVNSKQSSTSTEIKKGKLKNRRIYKSLLIIAFPYPIWSNNSRSYETCKTPETLVY